MASLLPATMLPRTQHPITSYGWPSLGLAPVITAQLFQVIQQIRDNGVTIFIVEQNVQTTLQIADHAYVLDQGKVVLQGPGATLAKEPRIRAAYLGI
jgi:branched-chain amino acid transport system ATP-binding protein